MSRYVRIVLILALVLIALPVLPANAAESPALPDGCNWVGLPNNAIGLICMPVGAGKWNGDLVIFAHGYVGPMEDLTKGFEQLYFLEGVFVPDLLTKMGYAFAATSYRTNGLAIKDGVADLVDLRATFIAINAMQGRPAPLRTYVVGVSEGGLITTQAIEQKPEIFSGGLACCGPVGDFSKQIEYWGDFRVVYDYYFPGTLKAYGPDAMHIPQTLITDWRTSPSVIQQTVVGGLAANPGAALQLMKVTRAAYDPKNQATIAATVLGVLDYSVVATNNGRDTLGGVPFGNKYTLYLGSSDDRALNKGVARFTANQAAKTAMNSPSYQTSGKLTKPLVTMHTTSDPIVPYWHEVLYQLKNWKSGTGANHLNIPIVRYGHCAFTAAELQFGFGLLVYKVTKAWPVNAEQALPNASLREQFRTLKANSESVVKPATE
jgi:pimeloyl-ACP methyl ester carboxylesterase